jgi:CHAT domain-containing protein
MPSRARRAGLMACAALSLVVGSGAHAAAPTIPRALTPKETTAWQALVTRAEAARQAGRWRELETLSRRRAALEEQSYGMDAAVTAASWSWIGQALVRQGKEKEAEPFFRRTLATNRKALGPRDPQTLLALSNLAGLLERQERFTDAEPLRRELHASAVAVFGPKSPQAAAATMALGDVLRASARAADAEPLYRAALEIDGKLFGEDDPRLAADLGGLGAALDDLGRHVEAESLHRRSLALRRKTFGERDAATAQAYARVAANLDAQGRYSEAEPLHRTALSADSEVRGQVHPATAADAAALGANLDAQKRAKEAEPFLRDALTVRRKTLGERHPDTGESYGALADNLAARGQRREAERLHRRALEIVLAAKGERAPASAAAWLALASDLSARGRHAEAEPLLRKALEARRTALGERHPATAAAYDALAANQQRLAAYAPAEALASQAVAIVRARRDADLRVAGADSEAALRRARAGADNGENVEPVFRRYLNLAWLAAQSEPSTLPRLREQAFTAAQELGVSPAARALAQTAARAAAGGGGAREARLRQDLAGQVRQIERQLVSALPQTDPAKAAQVGAALDAVGRELANLDAQLQRSNPRYLDMASPAPLSLAQVQAKLKPGEGLLLIAPAGDDVHVFAISKTKVAWNRIDRAAATLEARLLALRCQVDDDACATPPAEGALPAYDLGSAYAVYRDVIAPVEDALDGVSRLHVTASGAFGALPLGLLPTAAPKEGAGLPALASTPWLADRYALTTLPSVASLRVAPPPRRPAAQRWAFVGFGDPSLTGPTPGGRRLADPDALRSAYPPLPGTADELRAMARTLGAPAASLRLGGKATEAAIKTSTDLSRADVIAFATHGLLSREIGGVSEPGLVLTPPSKATAQDDGVLTASEAAALNLSAEWVILSACNTAGGDGRPGAENLSGLARAFLYAGARALLVSHWRVFDDATAALTVQTLAIQKANPKLTKAQALQRAMRVVRTGRRPDNTPLPGWRPEWAHPAYWAPFVVIAAGD